MMKRNKVHSTLILLALMLGIASLLTSCTKKKDNVESGGYYTCSMHPQVIQQESGDCPICGMKLSYIEAMHNPKHKNHIESHVKESTVKEKNKENKNFRFSLSRTLLTNSNFATVPVTKGDFTRQIKYTAHVDYNEDANSLVIISTKYDAWIESLLVSKEGQLVKKGQALIGFYSPSILAAKEEYLITYKTIKSLYKDQNKSLKKIYEDPTLKAARKKLSYLDVPKSQIKQLEIQNETSRRNYYTSPITGFIVKKMVLQGEFVKSGQEILRIANFSKLWVFIHIFEKDLSLIKKGQSVTIKTTAYPNKKFQGRIDLIYPFLNTQTKDIKARIIVRNQNNLLKPGMFAEVKVNLKFSDTILTVPDSTIIYSGEQSYAFVSLGYQEFELRFVEVQMTSEGKAVISKGLSEGDLVITKGQFLLDSETSLKAAISRNTVVSP